MTGKKIGIFSSIFFLFVAFTPIIFAEDTPALEVTPVRLELSGDPGQILSGTITLNNYTPNLLPLTVESQNCTVANNNGTPSCQSISQTTTQEKFAEWVNTDISSFSIESMGQQTINYTITIPSDATPGGHYGAILFSYYTSGDGSTVLGTIRSIGTIFLLRVNGEVVVDGNVTDIKTDGGGWGNGGGDNTRDKDFITSVFESIKSLFGGPKTVADIPKTTNSSLVSDNNSINTSGENSPIDDNEQDPNNVSFSITFENDGNTHIKPEGKIEIIDENGKPIKGIGKEILFNDLGAAIGDKIVDYLPVNDQGGNILPGTDRTFDISWPGFPYVDIDDTGKQVIKYKTLSEHYTNENLKGRKDFNLNFWEQIKTRIAQKKLKANITITHKDENGKDVEFNSAKDIYVEYTEQYIGWNIPVMSIIGGLITIIAFTWIKIAMGAKAASIVVGATSSIKSAAGSIPAARKTLIVAKKSETYYDILGVKKTATKKEISDAYKSLVKDKKGPKKIQKAYDTLSLKKTRDEYDKKLMK